MVLDFERIYREYSALIYRIGILYFRDAALAEDVVHDCFVKLFEKQPHIRDEGHLKGWLITVARNDCRTKAKHDRRLSPLYDDIRGEEFPDNGVLREVMRLPELDRTVVYLHYYEGYASKEIASFLKVTDGAVRARLKRARAALRLSLEDEYG